MTGGEIFVGTVTFVMGMVCGWGWGLWSAVKRIAKEPLEDELRKLRNEYRRTVLKAVDPGPEREL